MVIRKRCLLWDWTNTRDVPDAIEQLNFSNGPFSSVANWNAWTPPELKGRLPYRPTIRTPAQLDGNDWAMIADYDANHHEVVHYFNEPDRIPDCTPELAADRWRSQVVPLLRAQQGRKLVGPAVASDEAGRAWLRRFMALVSPDCVPDYLGVHYYGTAAAEAIAYITSMHEEWPDLPVVVSEVASISRSSAEVERFTAELANWMDETDWIYEYAFFGCMRHCADDFVSPAAQLMDGEGKFTPLMKRLMDEQPISRPPAGVAKFLLAGNP